MSNPDPSSILFSSRYKYLLNYDSDTGSVSVPAATMAGLSYDTFTVDIPIDNTQDFSQVQVNFSFDSSKWYSVRTIDIWFSTYFSVSTTSKSTGSNYRLTFYVVNQNPSSRSRPAFTITARGIVFIKPS